MNEINIELWKQANSVYAKLMDLTVSDALNQLNQMQDLDDELKSLILTLISSGSQPSQYFKDHIHANLQFDEIQDNQTEVGDKVGDYQLMSELGTGGMAKVYQAKKTHADSQKMVAIKLFNHSGLSPILMNRFSIEQDVLSGLSHPNIVNMHHGGTSEEGVPYIVMELIEDAQDIDHYVKSKRANLKQKVLLIIAAAQAIAYAHNNLIVHRDIKPSNLLVDGNGRLKVVDFGIAKLLTREDAPQKTTIMALTPSFASPEQINSGSISVTTDVFSLAAVCLALIVEDLPLPADRLLKSCAGDDEHIRQTLKSYVKDKDLRNILNQALQQDPKKRYRNMGLFADDLSAWIDNKPVTATRDSLFYRVSKFAKRRSALFAALSTLIVMLVVSVGVFSLQFKKTQAEATKANEVKDFMLDVFSVVNPDEALGEKIYAKDLLAQAFEDIKVKSFEDDYIKVELLSAIGLAQSQLGLNEQAAVSYETAIEIDSDGILPNIGMLQIHIEQNHYEAAEQQVIEIEKSITASSEHWPLFLLLKSKLASSLADFDKARVLATEAELIYQQRNQPKGFMAASRQLAAVMFMNSKAQQAASSLETKLIEAKEYMAPTSSTVLGIQLDLVELYNDQGEYIKAIKHAENLIENITKVFGDKHPFLVQAFMSQASTYRATGKIDEASSFADKAYELSLAVNGLVHQTTAKAKNLLGVLAYVKGDQEAALVELREAAKLYDQSLGQDHPDAWEVKANLAVMLAVAKKSLDATEILEPVFHRQVEILGKPHQSTLYTQSILTRLYVDIDRLNEAQIMGEEMLANAKDHLGETHPLTIGGHFTLATVYQKQKKIERAIALVTAVVDSFLMNDKNERIITAYNTLAELYFEQGDVEKATELKAKSLQASIDILGLSAPRTVLQIIKTGQHHLAINETEKTQEYIRMATKSIEDHDIKIPAIISRLNELKSQLNKTND